jgi:hypothetical protein
MRTLLRPGQKGVLVMVDRRGGPRFLVDGPNAADHQFFFDRLEAERTFAAIEAGRSSGLRRRRAPFVLVDRIRQSFKRRSHDTATR